MSFVLVNEDFFRLFLFFHQGPESFPAFAVVLRQSLQLLVVVFQIPVGAHIDAIFARDLVKFFVIGVYVFSLFVFFSH
jgi:hypothetical protein